MSPQTVFFLVGTILLSISRLQAAPLASTHHNADREASKLSQMILGDDESDLKSLIDARALHLGEAAAQEREMRSLGREEQQKFKATAEDIKTLAEALARMRFSQTQETGSDEESAEKSFSRLRENSDQGKESNDDQGADRQLVKTIAGALARLQSEDEPQSEIEVPQPPTLKNFREEAIRLVESRLLENLALAEKLGLSVDDLIQDFEEQESREETLMKLEKSLASLVGGRDE